MPDFDLHRAASRADLCRFLAACHYQPGPEFAEEKLFDSMLAAARHVDPDLAAHARRLGEAFCAEGTETLLVDYTRLFLGPIEILAKPYGSVWLEGEGALMRDSTIAVLDFYQEAGFEMDDEFRELPDHIAAELEFLYLLIYRENEAQLSGESDSAAAIARLRKRFLDEHLGAWIGPFTAAVKIGAKSAFYRELAEFTNRFVTIEAHACNMRSPSPETFGTVAAPVSLGKG
jgi:TorA maturation chaperone TorD